MTHWIYEPVQVTITVPERLLLPDDTPKTWGEQVDQEWNAQKRNKETVRELRRYIKNRRI